jgi:uncharacterized protein YdiU (UPF0061 family)
MRPLTSLDFDNSYARLGPAFSEAIEPTPLPNPYLVAFNPDAARLIDLDPAAGSDPDAAAYFSGARQLPGSLPVAAIYAGHQFGVWVPQLGDGRAILLGEVRNRFGGRWDLVLKGAGPTRFSRMGDGRAVLRSSIREYLGSEAMAGLGIPTTRALALVGSDEPVYREVPETAATLVRMAPTHVRFGTFQVFAARGDTPRVSQLMDHVIGHHEADLVGLPDRATRWLERVVDRTADLVAQWMAVGFAHGVMNTDNMSVLGLTLDYGPFGFLDEYQPGFICNHSDDEGRYGFDRQPAVGLWNLARFAEALLELVPFEDANAALGRYRPRFDASYGRLVRAKIGLTSERPDDVALIGEMLSLMAAERVDYHRWFRSLSTIGADQGIDLVRAMTRDHGRLDAWVARYLERLRAEGSQDRLRREAMNRVNPKYVLRSYLAQTAIERAQQRDYGEIERLRRILAAPFDEHPELERYADPPPPWGRDLIVSCSS